MGESPHTVRGHRQPSLPGNGQIHQLQEKGESLDGAVAMIQDEDTGQFAGFQLTRNRRQCDLDCYSTQIPSITVCPLAPHQTPAGYVFRREIGKDLATP